MSEIVGSVETLNLFPIKSCHAATVDGLAPKQLGVGRTGLTAYDVADREFVLAEPDGAGQGTAHFVTQRGWNHDHKLAHRGDARLAVIRTNITAEGLELDARQVQHGSITIPAEYDPGRPQLDVDIFGKLLPNSLDQGDEAADFFSSLLGRSIRLVRANRATPRQISAKYHHQDAVNRTAAADGHPLLLTNQSSLDFSHDKNHRPRGTVPIEQYRSNIATAGEADRPYDEDYWRRIRVGDMIAWVVEPCQRCPIPGIDQETAARGAGGQTVLRGRLGYIDDPTDKAVVFGENLNHHYEPGLTLAVGDPIAVQERSTERNFTLLG